VLGARSIMPFKRSRLRLRQTQAPMQIQSWEGVVLTCAETVVQSAIHDTMRGEAGCRENVQRRARLKEGEEGI
jgi:hypothetical protein